MTSLESEMIIEDLIPKEDDVHHGLKKEHKCDAVVHQNNILHRPKHKPPAPPQSRNQVLRRQKRRPNSGINPVETRRNISSRFLIILKHSFQNY